MLVKANTLANASVQQFSEALTNKAANAMAQLNIDVESGVAVLAAWADQGIKGSEAGERFNIVTRDLQTAARNNAEEFERFGIAVFDQEGRFRSLADIVADVEEALVGMSHEQQGATLAALGFTDRSIAATRSLLGSSEAIRGYEEGLRNAAGTTDEVANKQLEGLTGAWNELTSAVSDVVLEIGTRLEPALLGLASLLNDRLLPAVRTIMDVFNDLSRRPASHRPSQFPLAGPLGPKLRGRVRDGCSNSRPAIPLNAVHRQEESMTNVWPIVTAIGVCVGAVFSWLTYRTLTRYNLPLVSAKVQLGTPLAIQFALDLESEAKWLVHSAHIRRHRAPALAVPTKQEPWAWQRRVVFDPPPMRAGCSFIPRPPASSG